MARFSCSAKMVGVSLLGIAVAGAVSAAVGFHLIGVRIVSQAQEKVAHDIRTAQAIYEARIQRVSDIVRLTASRFFLRDAVRGDRRALGSQLREIRRQERLDVLTLVDAEGRVIARADGGEARESGTNTTLAPLVARVAAERETVAGTEVLPAEDLAREGSDLPDRARVPLVDTPRARPRESAVETAGLVLLAASPVLDEHGVLLAVLYGAQLLNRDSTLVDQVKEAVYGDETYEGKEIGTVTVFLGDVRVATNVPDVTGARAIGTRVSAEVGDRVLREGEPWIARAFVVNDWFLTAYQPIRNTEGRVVGILYVGMREGKFVDLRRQTTLVFLGVAAAGMILAGFVAHGLARTLLEPVRRLASASATISKGDFDVQVPVHSDDEIGALARAFNAMTVAIRERDEEIQKRTREQLFRAEKLASLGRLAAGVAHEINNPLTGILTFASALREDLPAEDPRRRDVEVIIREASRCGNIVRGLLDYARRGSLEVGPENVNDVIRRVVSLVEKQVAFADITFDLALDPAVGDSLVIDREKIQQVFLNLFLNAQEAMDGKGAIRASSRLVEGGRAVELAVSDTGPGIPEEIEARIFDPFYSTKETGTGLGLAVVSGIVRGHEGTIRLIREPGRGATFVIRLPRVAGEPSA